MTIERSSGVQLHITSLPSGRLGRDAYHFVDWLASAGQSWWQVLPLGPPDEAGSPYKASSAFAASPALAAEPGAPVTAEEARAFRERNAAWIEDWADFAGGDAAVDDQVRFDREWRALREYAAERGVRLIGDIPIYVAPDSADHVAHPELFRDGVVAGAPPDYFTELGQLWGNPIYDWPALQRRHYRWWVERFRRVFDLFDLARFDHFRGLVAYWEVPADAPDARGGRWVRGPGRALFDAAHEELGDLAIIAEDLGVITPPVHRLRDELGFSGMVVLQFAFEPDDPHGPHRPENHRENQVLYTGTHDNDTLRGWAETLPPERIAELRRAGVGEDEPWWDLIGIAMRSPARLAMLQIQDVLGLGTEARMNLPGTAEGNWGFRLQPGQLTAEHATRLRALTEEGGRA